jgi:hypothetical protein
VRLVPSQGALQGTAFAITFDEGHFALWRSREKEPGTRVTSGARLPAVETMLFLEGLVPSPPGEGNALRVVLEKGNEEIARDRARVRVARSAYLLFGHGALGQGAARSFIESRRIDGRRNPSLLLGADERTRRPVTWAASIVTSERGARFALAAAEACVAYEGHSNFGLGYSFATGFKRLSQFMNIADPQVPVNWPYLRDHQEHPELLFDDEEYGDDVKTKTWSDPVSVDGVVTGRLGTYDAPRFPLAGVPGAVRFSLSRGKEKWLDHHYGDPGNARIVIKAGARDMPRKRWSKLFLNSCYSGSYYFESFGGRGTLFFTHDEVSSASASTSFLRGCILGRPDDAILASLNEDENVFDYQVFPD